MDQKSKASREIRKTRYPLTDSPVASYRGATPLAGIIFPIKDNLAGSWLCQ